MSTLEMSVAYFLVGVIIVLGILSFFAYRALRARGEAGDSEE
mgnify:CR=1 FL=1